MPPSQPPPLQPVPSSPLAALIEGLIESVWLVDALSLRIVAVNRAACSLLGLAEAGMLGKPVIDFTGTPEDVFFWEDVAAGLEDRIHSETLVRGADGVAIPVERRVSRVWPESAQPVFLVGLRDLREQRRTEDELESIVAELRATLESTADGILVRDPAGGIRNYNRRFAQLWDVPEELMSQGDDRSLHRHMQSCVVDAEQYATRLEQIADAPLLESTDVLLMRSGKILERVSMAKFSRGQPSGRVYSFRDITEKLTAQQQIETLAYTDALTGLANRLLLGQRVEFALRLAERNGTPSAVFFLDLDRFKKINDSMGLAFGDLVLVEVAERIKGCLREVDTLSRLGGDEFVAFLEGADAHGAEIAARRMLDSLSRPFELENITFTLGCSIGVALYPDDGKTLDELVKCADAAMFRVKERGRGSFRFYQPQRNVDLLARMKMDHAMRLAMDQGLFRLHYQPQISLDTGALVGVEALIRWTDPEFGNVSPGVFIPLAEESGFIVTIGNWVMEEAVRQAKIWQRNGSPVTISVNVSALQFQQSDFVDIVAAVLRGGGLSPQLLELELTESILVEDANEALERLHALASLGIGLSIDDFGTGYSSLAYLKKFPISKLKIDRSFVIGLPDDESDRAIVSATIGMARALKLKVVAEGVETAAQRDYLVGLHCESFQGFLCSPGLPALEFEKLMKKLNQAQDAPISDRMGLD